MYPYGDERSPRSRTGLEAARSRPMPDLSVAEFAALKGVTTRTVRKWIAAGYVKAERVGPKLIRIPASELERVGNPISAA
jgi:excisionase family DNA binding protein